MSFSRTSFNPSNMNWQQAFLNSTLDHRAPYLSFIAWAHQVDVKKIAEIGVNKGETSLLFRNLFPQAELYLIDPWSLSTDYIGSGTPISRKIKHYEKAYCAVSSQFANDPSVHILRMGSAQAAKLTPNDFDLIFIDANHEYLHVKEDILSWLPKLRPGGILAGHDYEPSIPIFDGVKQAVDEIFGNQIMLGKDRLWIHKTAGGNSKFDQVLDSVIEEKFNYIS